MSLTINTNHAAVQAGFNLSRNSNSLQESINRLSSGKRINRPADDSGGLSVSMKLRSSINRLNGANNNIQNGVSFLEVQDGVLEAAGRIVDRMIELKGMSQDVMKNNFDNATYENEFRDLQIQVHAMAQQTFNGVSLFATTTLKTGGSQAVFNDASLDNTVSVFVSADGSAGESELEQSNSAFRSYHQLQHSCLDRFCLRRQQRQCGRGDCGLYLRRRRRRFNDELERRFGGRLQSSFGEHSGVASPKRREHVQIEFRLGQHHQAVGEHGSRLRENHGRGHRGRKHPFGQVQRVGSKFGRHALSSQLVFRRRTDASALKNEELTLIQKNRGPSPSTQIGGRKDKEVFP